MAEFNITVNLDWLDEETSIDDEIKQAVLSEVQTKLLANATTEITNKLNNAIADKLLEAEEQIEQRVDDFIETICEKNMSKITIPCKTNSWSSEVEYIPLTEFIGKRFEEQINKRVYDKHFKKTNYPNEAVYTMAEACIEEYLDETLSDQIEEMVQTAQKRVEETIVQDLETTLKENLAVETVKKMNIPQVLENLQRRALGEAEGREEE